MPEQLTVELSTKIGTVTVPRIYLLILLRTGTRFIEISIEHDKDTMSPQDLAEFEGIVELGKKVNAAI